MVPVKLDTGFNIEVEFSISPFYKRLFAWIIDLLICWAYTKLMSVVLAEPLSLWNWKGVLVYLPVIFYHPVSEITMNGRSLGKMAMNIKVITAEGGQPTIGQYLIRSVFRLVDFPYLIPASVILGMLPWWTLPLTFCGLICVIFTPQSQRIGDMLAGTIVIDLRNRTSWQDTVFTELEESYKPAFPQVMQLSDRDINTLKSIIQTVKKKDDFELSMKIAQRIKSKLLIASDDDSLTFLEKLLKDYNYYSTRD